MTGIRWADNMSYMFKSNGYIAYGNLNLFSSGFVFFHVLTSTKVVYMCYENVGFQTFQSAGQCAIHKWKTELSSRPEINKLSLQFTNT